MKWTFMSLQILDEVRSGKMTFAFPWYLENTYGCQKVEATYTFGN